MSKTEYAWVIKENNKNNFLSYNKFTREKIKDVSKNLYDAIMFKTQDLAQEDIKTFNLQNCVPVKVEISIIGEDDE